MGDEFSRVFDALPGFAWTVLPNGAAEFLNRSWCEYTALKSNEASGTGWHVVVHPDDLPGVLKQWQSILASGDAGEIEARMRHRDGDYRWFRICMNPMRNESAEIVRWIAVNTEIEDSKRAQEAMRSGEYDLRSVINTIPMMAWSTNADGYCDFCNQRWLNYAGLTLDQVQGWGWGEVIHPDDLEPLAQNWRSCLASGSPVDFEARMRRFDGVYRWFLFLGNPMRDSSERIVKWFGTNIDIEDRKRAEQELKAKEQALRATIDTIPSPAFSTNADGYVDFLNRRWLDFAGMTAEQAQGWGWRAALHPEDEDRLVQYWQSCLSSGTEAEIEARYRRFDGAYRWCLVRANPLRDESGTVVKWYGISIDIEDRKQAEEGLRANERNLIEIINTIPTTAWATRPDGYCEFLSDRWLDYAGFTYEQAVGWGWASVIHPDDIAGLQKVWLEALATGTPVNTEARMRRFDGVYRWFIFLAKPFRDDSGTILRWYGTNVDIEDRKQANEALRASERALNLIINTIPMLAWSTDPTGFVEFLNQRWLEFTGLSADQASGFGWSVAIHPDDKQGLIDYWQAALEAGTEVDVEARMRRFDGEYRWFLFRASPLRDENGTIIKWYGTNVDIEDRKQADEALRTSERNLTQIINSMPMTAWTALPDGSVDYLNQRWLDYAGMSMEDARGWGWANAVHPDDVVGLQDYWKTVLAAGIEGAMEARIRRFDGVYRWFLMRASPFRDDAGHIVKWYGTNTDVEEFKRAEEELRRSEAFLAEGQRLNLSGSFSWRLDTDEVTFSDQLYRIYEFERDSPVTFEMIISRVLPEDAALVSGQFALARDGQSDLNYEFRLRMPDGSVKFLRTVAHATKDRIGRPEVIGSVQDVTERQLAEDALSKVRSELTRMARVATLGALTASIAHEVSQPLSGIITNANTGLRMLGAAPPNVDGALETIRRTLRDGNRASEVISKLRALFSNKSSNSELVNLNEATREVFALVMSELQRNRVILRSELAEDLPNVIGDRIQLQQVILNLILNASDAMSTNGDLPRRLAVGTERDGDDSVRMTVQDTGIGIDPASADRLFDAFYTTKNGGMGMGLSVSRSIIESHHGRLWALSNEGPGATFCFSIPRASNATAEAQDSASIQQPALNKAQSVTRDL